jgi:serine protease
MRKIKLILLAITLFNAIAFGAPADALRPANEQCVRLGPHPSLIVKFKNKSSALSSNAISIPGIVFTASHAMSDGYYILPFRTTSLSALSTVTPGCYTTKSINHLLKALQQQPTIESVSPNILLSMQTISDKQWDMLAPPGGLDLNNAWNTTNGNAHATIAVLDTGIVNNTSLNPNVLPGVSFTNNGSHAVGATPSCLVDSCGYYHGTHVAGTIAATGASAYGETIYGVAPSATILPVNIFTKFTDFFSCQGSPPCLLSYTSDEVNALKWLSGTRVSGLPAAPSTVVGLNMSLGGSGSCATSMQYAFNAVINRAITPVIAAGNSNADASNFTPANCSGVIPVAATGPSGERSYYSNFGSIVKIAAPGGDDQNPTYTINQIYSTVLNGYKYLEGTSMATPHVTGVVALLYAIDPTLTPATVISRITNGSAVTPFPQSLASPMTACTTNLCGAGIVNALGAATVTSNAAPTLFAPSTINATNITFNSAMITWSGAHWTPSKTTGLLYTVKLNNNVVPNCLNIAATSCQLTGLSLNTTYSVTVSVTDYRVIHALVSSSTVPFTTTGLVAPTLSRAARNPFAKTTGYLYYTTLGSSATGIIYSTVGAPTGTRIALDTANKRFILSNVQSARGFSVAVRSTYGNSAVNSNTITFPSIS